MIETTANTEYIILNSYISFFPFLEVCRNTHIMLTFPVFRSLRSIRSCSVMPEPRFLQITGVMISRQWAKGKVE